MIFVGNTFCSEKQKVEDLSNIVIYITSSSIFNTFKNVLLYFLFQQK